MRARMITMLFGVAVAVTGPGRAMDAPVAVAPGDDSGKAVVQGACPTFHWSEVDGAASYELTVFHLGPDGQGATEIYQVQLPGRTQGWTPTVERCLEPGARYAWALRALGSRGQEGPWSQARLFEISAAPTVTQVETALRVLRRWVEEKRMSAEVNVSFSTEELESPSAAPLDSQASEGDPVDERLITGELQPPMVPAIAPVLGLASLTLDEQVHLGANSQLFKEGEVLLWEDAAAAVTSLGRAALGSNTTGNWNTAIGFRALSENTSGISNTSVGFESQTKAVDGFGNTSVGTAALRENTNGFRNSAVGVAALAMNVSGSANIGVGFKALPENTSGSRNTAIGPRAGLNATTGNDNIYLGSGAEGVAAESGTIRIGGKTVGVGLGLQNRTFINGIRGATVANATAVLIDANTGQLGTVSSSRRFKEDIEDMANASSRLLALRPVTFRFKESTAGGKPQPREFGLIAEEVAASFPELAVYDDEGRPQTVKYHLLSTLLLNELQRLDERVRQQEKELDGLRRQLGTGY